MRPLWLAVRGHGESKTDRLADHRPVSKTNPNQAVGNVADCELIRGF